MLLCTSILKVNSGATAKRVNSALAVSRAESPALVQIIREQGDDDIKLLLELLHTLYERTSSIAAESMWLQVWQPLMHSIACIESNAQYIENDPRHGSHQSAFPVLQKALLLPELEILVFSFFKKGSFCPFFLVQYCFRNIFVCYFLLPCCVLLKFNFLLLENLIKPRSFHLIFIIEILTYLLLLVSSHFAFFLE